MADKSKRIDPDFIAKPKANKQSSGPFAVPKGMKPEVMAPTKFDEDRIKADLQQFSGMSNIFSQYAERLYSRFTKAGEIDLIHQWVSFYEAGKNLVEAQIALERAAEIKRKEKEAEIAKLEANTAEDKLRKEQSDYKRQNISRFVSEEKGSGATILDDKKFEEYRSKRRNDIRYKQFEAAVVKVAGVIELQRMNREQKHAILADRTLSTTEQAVALELLEELYTKQLKKLRKSDTDEDDFTAEE